MITIDKAQLFRRAHMMARALKGVTHKTYREDFAAALRVMWDTEKLMAAPRSRTI